MNKTLKYFLNIAFIFSALLSNAQDMNDPNETANILHQNGQIYLVVFVLVTIFAGIIFYLVRLEKKLHQLEKNQTH